MPGDSRIATVTGLPVVDRNARNRVLSWLSHQDSAPRQSTADCVAVFSVGASRDAVEAPKADPEIVDSPGAVPAPTARQKVALFWKKCEHTLSRLTRRLASG
jgi:hypothetical protein